MNRKKQNVNLQQPADSNPPERNLYLSVADAQQQLLDSFAPLEAQDVSLENAAGKLLAADVAAPYDLPPFPNSSMDGFAIHAKDVERARREQGVSLPVVMDIPAGTMPVAPLLEGQAARIMTGAVLPEGADAVAPVEDTDIQQRMPGLPLPEQVTIFKASASGDNIRPRGQDVRRGETVLVAGQKIRPQEIGLLSMLGYTAAPVHRAPRVAVFSTGDELLGGGEPLEPGKIYDSNRQVLLALLKEYGAEPLDLGIAPDQEAAVLERMQLATQQQADLILTSAGVSVGAFDFVRSVVERHGELSFWRVNMRPGKPLAFGRFGRIPFIGLPGNPVSAFVTFEVFVRPAIRKMCGETEFQRPVRRVKLLESIESDGRESYLRARVFQSEDQWQARLTGHQGSGNLRSLVQANALLIVPSGVKSMPAGADVNAWIIGDEIHG